MYKPKHFEPPDRQALFDLINQYPLATLVINTSSGISADHIPLRLHTAKDNKLLLQGHIARANPLMMEKTSGHAIAIFHGPETYISPNWYPTKQEYGKVVPTWNYTTVHASAPLKFIDDPAWKLTFLEKLTDEHELNQEKPWSVSDAPKEFTQKLLSAIVGLEISIIDLSGKWKVSQNQPEQNQLGVRSGLEKIGHPDTKVLSGLKPNKPG